MFWQSVIGKESRLARERTTVRAMVQLYCRGKHGTGGELCATCAELMAYVDERLARCPWGALKPTCAKCPVHCYRGDMRERIRSVMRYAGPRMFLRHPRMAVAHMLDGQRSAPRNRREG